MANSDWMQIDKQEGGYAIISLKKEPVNSMSLEFWQALQAAYDTCEADRTVRGVIFTSGLKKNVFTAGLDLKELHAPSTSEERLFTFWRTLSKVLISVYSSKMVTIAAIPGACPAGGCCLSLCCDYRIITKDGSMGLNETAIGIPVPMYWVRLMADTVGQRNAEYLLQTGALPKAPQLLELGMVDKVAEGKADVLSAAEAEMQKWLMFPDSGRQATKDALRSELQQAWTTGMDNEAQIVWDTISTKATSDFLGGVMAKLSGKKKPKSKL